MATKNHNLSDYDPNTVPNGEGMRIGIVVSDWNGEITGNLLAGCTQALLDNGVREEDIVVRHVPGAFELTFAASFLAQNGDYDAIIGLGCIIRGETPHFDFIAQGVAQGFSRLNAEGDIPYIFGVLTDNDIEQSRARSGGALGNKGTEAAITALKMASFVLENMEMEEDEE